MPRNDRLTLPLQRYRALETASAAIARHEKVMFSRTIALEAVPPTSGFQLTINTVAFDTFKLCAVSSTGHNIRLVDEENVAALIPLRGTITADDGRMTATAAPGDAIVTGPPRRVTTVGANYVGLVLLTSRHKLTAYRERSSGGAPIPDTPAITRRLATDDASAGALGRYTRFLTGELDRSDTLIHSPRLRAATSALLLELVAESFDALALDGETRRMLAAPWQVVRAESFMREHAGEPLTIAAVAEHVGTSVRALQAAFQRHHGLSPRAYLNACRLEIVHKRLSEPGSDGSVTDVAYASGVAHLGRFAMRYRQRFGELPSETLARSRRKH